MLVTEDKCCDTVCGGYTCGQGWQADPTKVGKNKGCFTTELLRLKVQIKLIKKKKTCIYNIYIYIYHAITHEFDIMWCTVHLIGDPDDAKLQATKFGNTDQVQSLGSVKVRA